MSSRAKDDRGQLGHSWLTGWRAVLGADLRSLALFRVGLALVLLADIAQRLTDLQVHYTDFGLLPRGPLLSRFMNGLCVCLHVVTGTAVGQVVLFALQAGVAVLLALGWRTRLMTMLSWSLLYSVHLRNPVVLQGGDDLLRMLAFWAMFAPLGARFSVDAALADAAHSGRRGTRDNRPWCAVGSVALLGQVLLMYWSTAVLKTGAEWHAEGSAVYYALHFDQLALRPALWLRDFYPLTVVLTHLTMFWETFGPFFLLTPIFFGPLRTLACLVFIGMHHGFALCLMLGLFPWIDTISMLMLLPGWLWERLERRLPQGAQRAVTIYFDAPCDICKKFTLIIRELLLLSYVAIEPAQARPEILSRMQRDRSWVVADGATLHTGWAAFVALCRVSPLLGWAAGALGRPAPSRLGERAYRAIADGRPRLATFSAILLPYGEPRPHPRASLVSSALAAGLLALITAWNTAGWPGSRVHFPEALRPVAYLLRIDQDWGMFAPFPQKEDGWYVVPGHLQNGDVIDVYRQLPGPVSFAKPDVVSDMFKNQRWSKYMMNIWLARNSDYRLYYGQYLCRSINGTSNQRTPTSLVDFEIVFMKEMTQPGYHTSAPERVVIWKHYCFEVPKA